MFDYQMGVIESRFADMIWKNEPILSSQLSKLCEKELGWKKSTTYTVLKRLCDKGIFQNNGGTVSSCISRDGFYAKQSEQFVEQTFHGSLPAFLAAFTANRALKAEEIESLRRMVDEYKEG